MRAIIYALLVFFLVAGQAYAQQPQNQPTAAQLAEAKTLYQQGEDYFKLGEFQKALDAYKEAYRLSHKPLFLLNIGQCHFKLGQFEEAKHSYEAMLREDPNTPYKAELEEKIVKMQQLMDEEKAKQEAAATQMAAMSQPIINNTYEAPTRKGLLFGSIAGGVVLGGATASYFLFIRNVEQIGERAPNTELDPPQESF